MGNDNRASQICAARPNVVKAVAIKVAVFPQIRMLFGRQLCGAV